jgi:hypothetical protein
MCPYMMPQIGLSVLLAAREASVHPSTIVRIMMAPLQIEAEKHVGRGLCQIERPDDNAHPNLGGAYTTPGLPSPPTSSRSCMFKRR